MTGVIRARSLAASLQRSKRKLKVVSYVSCGYKEYHQNHGHNSRSETADKCMGALHNLVDSGAKNCQKVGEQVSC